MVNFTDVFLPSKGYAMKAMVLDRQAPINKRPLILKDITLPEPSVGEIRIRIQFCGVCHTDLHIVEGDLPLKMTPLIPGHQVVGIVDKRGPGVQSHAEGDRIGAAWLYSTCGVCGFCRCGDENLCDSARFTGWDFNGGYAEYMVVPAKFAYRLPAHIPGMQAAPLMCAGIIGFRSLRLSEIRPGQRIGLWGFGASAHVTIQIARYWGCDVYVFTRQPKHRDHALELGAVWAGGPDDTPPEPMHSSIIFAPSGEIVPKALNTLARGGVLAINAIHMSPIPELKYSSIYHERTVRSITNCTRYDAIELLKLAASIPIKTDVTLYGLDQANEALHDIKRSSINGAAVLKVVK